MPDRLEWVGLVYSNSGEPMPAPFLLGTTGDGMIGHVNTLIQRDDDGPRGTVDCDSRLCNFHTGIMLGT